MKERYEVHHGVRIQDSALVAAATLSHRYITDRFLPDKAVDLIDEAASRLRMELDSMPTEIDQLERQIMQLEIEQNALKKEKDAASRERLGKIEKQLADLKEQSSQAQGAVAKRESCHQRRGHRQQPAGTGEAGVGESATQRRPEHCRANPVRNHSRSYRRNWPDAEKASHDGAPDGKRLLSHEVTEEDIAKVVASWTGIPVTKMLEGERQKLVKMEERLQQRVIGQEEAVKAVSNAVRRARSGLAGSESTHWLIHLSGPDRRGKNGTGPRIGGVPVR